MKSKKSSKTESKGLAKTENLFSSLSRKHSVFRIIGLSFQKWWQNFVIVLPFVFNAFALGFAMLFFLFIFALIAVYFFHISLDSSALKELAAASSGTGTTNHLSPETINAIQNTIHSSFTPLHIFYFIIVAIVLFAVYLLISAYFHSGAIAMTKSIASGKKTALKEMLKAKKFFFRFWLIELIISAGVLFWFFLFSLPSLISRKVNLLIIPLLSIVPLIFAFIFFLPAQYLLVIYDLSIKDSFKKSILFARNNYWSLFGFVLLLILISAAISSIPIIKDIAVLLVAFPVQIIAFVFFIIERIKNKDIKNIKSK